MSTYLARQQTSAYVRAGLDHRLADERAFSAYLTKLLRTGPEGGHTLTTGERASVAVAAIRGHLDHHWNGEPVGSLHWHRYLAGIRVRVTKEGTKE